MQASYVDSVPKHLMCLLCYQSYFEYSTAPAFVTLRTTPNGYRWRTKFSQSYFR